MTEGQFVPPGEWFPKVRDAIASLDEKERVVALIRLAADLNNGSEHFDHGDDSLAYSWLCLACARAGRGPYFVDAREMGIVR